MQHPLAAAFEGYEPIEQPLADLRPSAVMLLLVGEVGREDVVFQVRTQTVRFHKGEISLPGGRKDDTDESYLHTALRETEEEVGVPREAVDVLGALDDVVTVGSRHLIRPYAGVLRAGVEPTITAAREVSELIHVPLAHLQDERSRVWKVVENNGSPQATPAFEYEGHVIWGATARIVGQFLALTSGVPGGDPVTVILVRHAESEGNIGGVIQGWTDLPLTDIGEQQAQMVARRFKGASIAAVYSSPLYRARETARPIADVLALPLVEVDDLRERYYGQAQGLTWTEAAERWPLGVAEHHRDWAMAVPEVESLAGLRRRSVAVVNRLLDEHRDETAIVVSHGGTLVQVIAHLFGLPEEVWPRIRMSNTSVTIVEGDAAAPVVRTLNDICHLEDRARASTLAL